MPAEYKRFQSADFEPYQGPSLFSNFKRSMTTDEKMKSWHKSRRTHHSEKRPTVIKQLSPVCGDTSSHFKHTYIGDASCFGPEDDLAPPCKSCAILVQTLDRLRKNLSASEPSSPTHEHKPAATSPSPRSSHPTSPVAPPLEKSPEDWYRASAPQTRPQHLASRAAQQQDKFGASARAYDAQFG
jgi:hypothetical protein